MSIPSLDTFIVSLYTFIPSHYLFILSLYISIRSLYIFVPDMINGIMASPGAASPLADGRGCCSPGGESTHFIRTAVQIKKQKHLSAVQIKKQKHLSAAGIRIK